MMGKHVKKIVRTLMHENIILDLSGINVAINKWGRWEKKGRRGR